MRTIATLITSAAVPCITVFTASRSPSERVWRFDARSSGIGLRRPRSVVTYPSAAACAIVRLISSCTRGSRARYVSISSCASSRGMPRFSESPNDEMP